MPMLTSTPCRLGQDGPSLVSEKVCMETVLFMLATVLGEPESLLIMNYDR